MCISVNIAVPHLCVIAVNVKGGGRLILFYQLTSGAVTHMGQFLQDGKNEQTLSEKIIFGASL